VTNLDTHILQSFKSMAAIIQAARQPLIDRNVRLLARLQEIAALAALDPDDLAAANELLDRIHAMAAKE
jgi:hypothetical protein